MTNLSPYSLVFLALVRGLAVRVGIGELICPNTSSPCEGVIAAVVEVRCREVEAPGVEGYTVLLGEGDGIVRLAVEDDLIRLVNSVS
jgi:hypothetical protein